MGIHNFESFKNLNEGINVNYITTNVDNMNIEYELIAKELELENKDIPKQSDLIETKCEVIWNAEIPLDDSVYSIEYIKVFVQQVNVEFTIIDADTEEVLSKVVKTYEGNQVYVSGDEIKRLPIMPKEVIIDNEKAIVDYK